MWPPLAAVARQFRPTAVPLLSAEDHSRPRESHPRPVVLVHGTNDSSGAWADAARVLRAHGHLVYAPDYGRGAHGLRGRNGSGGLADIDESTREVTDYVHWVLDATGAEAIDLVGHSQGGLLAHRLACESDLPIGRLVTLAATVSGARTPKGFDQVAHTRPVAAVLDALLGPSARQQIPGSALLGLVADRVAPRPEITYVAIASRADRTARAADRRHAENGIRQLWLPDSAHVAHEQMPRHPLVIALLLDLLDG